MMTVKLAQKNREKNPESWQTFYETSIIRKIRRKYSLNQELAILRQRDSKAFEFEEYNAYVEACKAEVKQELGI